MVGVALSPSLTLRIEVLSALREARRRWDERGAPWPELDRADQVRVSGLLARAVARAAWPLPAWLARLPSPPAPGSEMEDNLLAAAAAVHRLSPHRVAFAVAVELLDVVAVLDRPSESVEAPRRG